MHSAFHIQYLSHNQIDKKKWDDCIDKSGNGLIYGYSTYLDYMSKQWDGLVLNDYDSVMPLTWNRKYGIAYLYQPFLSAQLGVFGNNITQEMLEAFLNAVPTRFRYWDIYLNHQNIFSLTKFPIYQRTNFVLPLNESYETLYAGYRENVRRNIRKAQHSGCRRTRDIDIDKVIELARAQMSTYSNSSAEDLERFRRLYQFLHNQGKAIAYGILGNNEEVLASCAFIFSHNRAYYILVGNHPNGRTIGASHALIDAFIKDHAGENVLLDFEGSDIRNLAFFYSSFGAREEQYGAIRLNQLPFYLQWLKRGN